MRIGIIGAIGVDDIGDVIMLEVGLESIKTIANRNGFEMKLLIFAINKQKVQEQINIKGFHAEVVEALKSDELDEKILSDFDFETITNMDFSTNIHILKLYYNIRKCDALYFIGGGYFNQYWDKKLISTFVIPLAIASKINMPVFISGVNLGPFSSLQLLRFKGLLAEVKYLILRDRESSIKILEGLGGTKGKVILGADDILPRWFIPKTSHGAAPLGNDEQSYGVLNLHHWVEMFSSSYIHFYQSLAQFINCILDKQFINRIYFLPFDYYKGLDYECGRRLETFLNNRKNYLVLEPTNDHIYMREIIANSSFVISSRYHPVVFALGEQVPVLGIYTNDLYYQKISGAFKTVQKDEQYNMLHVNDVSLDQLGKWYSESVLARAVNKGQEELIANYKIEREQCLEDFLVKSLFEKFRD